MGQKESPYARLGLTPYCCPHQYPVLEGHKVEVDQLSGWPDLPVGQDDVGVVLGEVLLDVLQPQALKGGDGCHKDTQEGGSEQGLVQGHLSQDGLGSWDMQFY